MMKMVFLSLQFAHHEDTALFRGNVLPVDVVATYTRCDAGGSTSTARDKQVLSKLFKYSNVEITDRPFYL